MYNIGELRQNEVIVMPYIINGRFVWVNSYTMVDLEECKKIEIEVEKGGDPSDITETQIEEFFNEYEQSIQDSS